MNRKWLLKKTNREYIDYITRSVSINPLTAQILVNRGINTPERVRSFIDPELSSMADPFVLPGMKKAVKRIRRAAESGEKVVVHGDYDADGTTSTSILLHTLIKLGIGCNYFIPNRFKHGYGFNTEAIKVAKKNGARLIITVDCGIGSFDETSEARRNGIDVIITDHHEPYKDEYGAHKLPDAYAVVNPGLMPPDGQLPLCGAGIALKISIALLGIADSLELFDLAAIGTIADMVPLTGDNRLIIKKGLELINRNSRESIRALREVASVNGRQISEGGLSFGIIPRINASGRIAEASEVVRLFMSGNIDETYRIARVLDNNNARRQRIEEIVFNETLSMLKSRSFGSCIMLSSEEWHEGVVGIVASKIADIYHRPTFIFSVRDGIARGSARSVPAFDICRGLSMCSEYLVTYGGHKQAAGLTLHIKNMRDFELKMHEIISDVLKSPDCKNELLIDAEVTLKDISFPLIAELMKIGPFGPGNEEPLLASRRLEVISHKSVGNNHLKMRLRQGYRTLDAIGFSMSSIYKDIDSPGHIDAVFSPAVNEWNGSRSLQLQIKTMRPSTL
ncbi:single-stranded-DNA-specific exonuclease RecJ [bacterium BMS3Abin07]|nr:single-stranded-DNA-specific exonuclease RecJ [bacterium BMS3Abin07]GBE31231.1 single-stranded-DNA-specific exonuclease RecJ [bacterium BMS3Bbin05]HDO23508.1 single-stranded-DNA-specific exonuclease RecJ [Nitrospirota bacterium]HDZ87540.1 single-stranded-DNA-specific exonuclease RecJ [Nitrospirota bacterium]